MELHIEGKRNFSVFIEKMPIVRQNPFCLQIGAMDGISFDMAYRYLIDQAWHGLLVEPAPDMYEKLQINYKKNPNMRFENAAVTERDGTIQLTRIDPKAVEDGLIYREALGISTIVPNRGLMSNAKFQEEYKDVLQRYLHKIDVPAISFPHLIDKHNITNIDLLLVDTEGADCMILQEFLKIMPRLKQKPQMIMFEHIHVPPEEIVMTLGLYNDQDYKCYLCMDEPTNFMLWLNENPQS
jgi:FkbM family methyltransferase